VAVVPVSWHGANGSTGRLAAIRKLKAPHPLSMVIQNRRGDASMATLHARRRPPGLLHEALERLHPEWNRRLTWRGEG
jgi:hypothetical protein